MNAPCQLCGYRASRGHNVSPLCPVCGQEYATNENQADDCAERDAEPDAEGLLNVVPSDAGTSGGAEWRMGAAATVQGTINLELQSLLQRLPQQGDFRRKEHELLSAATALATCRAAENCGDNCDPNAVYIRSRADPTMRVLKGRYKAQPRGRRAASMSALHRLADPLTGYDSMEALTPKARKRRQENVQRSSVRGRVTNRPSLSAARRRSTARFSTTSTAVHTPMTISIDAVHSQRRTSAAVCASRSANKQFEPFAGKCWSSKKQHTGLSARAEGIWNPGCGTRQSSAVSGNLREGRTPHKSRAQFRRKRVATMRSVNGWVRESDPASTRRRASLEKRVLSLGRGISGRIASESRLGQGPTGDWHTSQENKNDTFLTAVDAGDVTLQGPVEKPENGVGEIGDGLTRYDGSGRRIAGTESCRVPVVDGRRIARGGKRREGQDADAHKLGRRQSFVEAACGPHTMRTTPARDGKNAGLARGRGYKSAIALHRCDIRGVRRRLFKAPSVDSVSKSRCRGSLHYDVADLLSSKREAPVSPGVVMQGVQWNVGTDDRRDPRYQRWMERRDPNKEKMLTSARTADIHHPDKPISGRTYAWGVQDSNTARRSSTEHGVSRCLAENTEVQERPLNAWQRLRGVGASTVHSVTTLHHFEDKAAGAETRREMEPSQSRKQQRRDDAQSVHQSDRREAKPLPRTTTASPKNMLSRRAKRRPANRINDKYIGRMQRLDRVPKTVGDALGRDIGQPESCTMIAASAPGDGMVYVTPPFGKTTMVDITRHPRKTSRQQPCRTRGVTLGGGEGKGGWGCGYQAPSRSHCCTLEALKGLR